MIDCQNCGEPVEPAAARFGRYCNPCGEIAWEARRDPYPESPRSMTAYMRLASRRAARRLALKLRLHHAGVPIPAAAFFDFGKLLCLVLDHGAARRERP